MLPRNVLRIINPTKAQQLRSRRRRMTRMPIIPLLDRHPLLLGARARRIQICVLVLLLSCLLLGTAASAAATVRLVESSSLSSSSSQPLNNTIERDIPRRRVADRLYHHHHHHGETITTNSNNNNNHQVGTLQQQQQRYLAVTAEYFRVIIEGHTKPLFFCPECAAELQAEQDALWKYILVKTQQTCPTASTTGAVKLVRRNQKVLNALTVQIPQSCATMAATKTMDHDMMDDDARYTTMTPDERAAHIFVQSLLLPQNKKNNGNDDSSPMIAKAYLSGDWYPANFIQSVEYIGATRTTRRYCLKGAGVRIAILDSGLDYTHEALSGNGTMSAYSQATANPERGELFPTERVVDGYDFIGDFATSTGDNSRILEDDDPIDVGLGHGTGVAHAVLGVAGEAELLGFRVCVPYAGCPDTAIISAIEYALDPNQDGDTSDHVDIINLSLGSPYSHPYYSPVAKAVEDAFSFGVLTVVSAGNFGNRPGIIFQIASTPNALAVGATGAAETTYENGMADFSSRGPSASLSVEVKPDIVAPGGPFDLAAAGTGDVYHKGLEGTSYSAPLVAGGAALVKERCPECSPFAIKCILMNTASRTVRYLTVDASKRAPISWAGAGELQVFKAIEADFWAYNLGDTQPSLSLGVLNVAQDLVVSKTIRVQLLDTNTESSGSNSLGLRASFDFRDPARADLDIMQVSFTPETFELDRRFCGDVHDVIVTFSIKAANVPSNHMTSTGEASINPVASLDPNELDGWVVFTTTSGESKDVSLPFHSIVRKAADVRVENTLLPDITSRETIVSLGLENVGAGVAQIDTFELVHTSGDDPEGAFGTSTMPADFRYIGYRTILVGEPSCNYLVEFAFTSWENMATSVNTFYEAHIDRNNDGVVDVVLSNRGPQQHRTNYTECRVLNSGSSSWSCSGFAPDHSGYSSNMVTRACSNDLGLNSPSTIQVRFTALSFSRSIIATENTGFSPIVFPNPALAGPSFNVNPGTRWGDIVVNGPGVTPNGELSKGLLLITNSYRNGSSTGASTKGTEAIVITRRDTAIFQEVTPDQLTFPTATDVNGPLCETWARAPASCDFFDNPAIDSVLSFDELFGQPDQPNDNRPPLNGETCTETGTPRSELSTRFPTDGPTSGPTFFPTSAPTPRPTFRPTSQPTGTPTLYPTNQPSPAPTNPILEIETPPDPSRSPLSPSSGGVDQLGDRPISPTSPRSSAGSVHRSLLLSVSVILLGLSMCAL